MNIRHTLCVIAIGLCGLSALAEDDYFPMAVGDDWTMALTIGLPNGLQFMGIAHRRIERTVDRDGKTYFRLRVWAEGLPIRMNYTILCRKDEKAFYILYERDKNAIEQTETGIHSGLAPKRRISEKQLTAPPL